MWRDLVLTHCSVGYRNAVIMRYNRGQDETLREAGVGRGRTGDERVEKATGLWRWKKEGEREWRRPTRYLATTAGGGGGCQRESSREVKRHTPSQGVPGEAKRGHVFAMCFQFLYLFVELCAVSGGGGGGGGGGGVGRLTSHATRLAQTSMPSYVSCDVMPPATITTSSPPPARPSPHAASSSSPATLRCAGEPHRPCISSTRWTFVPIPGGVYVWRKKNK